MQAAAEGGTAAKGPGAAWRRTSTPASPARNRGRWARGINGMWDAKGNQVFEGKPTITVANTGRGRGGGGPGSGGRFERRADLQLPHLLGW